MWISSRIQKLLDDRREEVAGALIELARAQGTVQRLELENTRLRSDIDWFKLRLNQVEKERAQLILHATGTPVSFPTFTPAQEDPEKALQEIPDFALVGSDAPEDYSMMPKRAGN